MLVQDCLESKCSDVKSCLIFSSFIFIALACSAGGSFHFTFLSCLELKCPKNVAALSVVTVLCQAARVSACPALQSAVGACAQEQGPWECCLQRAAPSPSPAPSSRHRLWFLENCSVAEVPQVHQSDQAQILDLHSDLCFVYVWVMLLDVSKARMVQGCSQVKGAFLKHSTSP